MGMERGHDMNRPLKRPLRDSFVLNAERRRARLWLFINFVILAVFLWAAWSITHHSYRTLNP